MDQTAAIQHLSRIIQCETISEFSGKVSNPEAFVEMHDVLFTIFPEVFKQAQIEKFGEFALLLKWQGSHDQLKPMLLIAHQDVVPVEETEYEHWQYPPFSGTVANGFIHGRGALDMKSSLIAILEAMNQLILDSILLKRTVYLYLGDDEEVGGVTAKIASEWMRAQNISLSYIIDEGGVILEKMIPALDKPICMIGVGQKGMLNLELTVTSESGHSSIPPKTTPIDILGAAISKLKHCEMPVHVDALVFTLFEKLAPYMPFTQRVLLSNLWLSRPLITHKLAQNPLMNAMMRTTLAPTMFHAGFKFNILPEMATAVINCRLYPGDTEDTVVSHIQNLLKNTDVTIKVLESFKPPKVSSIDSASFKIIEKTVRTVHGDDLIVAPVLTIGGTDGRHFAQLADNTYHFLYMRGSMEDFKGYHGINERISIQNFLNSIDFYQQLLINSQEHYG